jgi:HTH-like domain
VEPACAVLEISPSTYYAAKKREENPAARDERDEELKKEILQAREKKGRKLYGAKKMWRELNRDGIEVARCTVERLMREMGLEGLRARKKRPRTTVPGPAGQERPSDLLERDFTAPAPNRRWVAAHNAYWVQPVVMCGPAGRSPCGLAGRGGSAVHNQRLWRKARSWSLGRYRAGAGVRGSASRCSAASLAARSASR